MAKSKQNGLGPQTAQTESPESQIEKREAQKDVACMEEVKAVLDKYNRDILPQVTIRGTAILDPRCVIVRKPSKS
jgi:hypothetical protein